MEQSEHADGQSLEYSINFALSRLPLRAFRELWQATNELEQRVVAASIREYLEIEKWEFRRNAVHAADGLRNQHDDAIEEVTATCGGEPRAAIKALLVANKFLEEELERQRVATSSGFSRGKLSKKQQS